MKYKLLGLAAAVLLVAAAVAFTCYRPSERQVRIHQHLTARHDTGCNCDRSELCTHLPLVVIDTGGQEIPGKITGEIDSLRQPVYSTSPDGGSTINVEVRVIDNQDRNNHPSDESAFVTRSGLRIRGHSSRRFPKSSYLLKFVDDSGMDQDIPVMGMDAHHEWALHGPILDQSLIRNYMWYNISGEIMEYAPDCRFCEVVIDGSYEGLYLMTETVTNGDGCRLNLSVSARNAEGSGYLLRIDRPTQTDLETPRDVYTFSERSFRNIHDVSIRYPGQTKLTLELSKDIELDYSAFEKALYSYDHDTGEYGYWNWIDVDSFAQYYLIAEFTKNLDMGSYSTYLYQEPAQKYRLCVWDFNSACDNYIEDAAAPWGFSTNGQGWFFMLLKDETFVERVLRQYARLRQGVLSETYLLTYIDETLDYLGPAVERNNRRWADEMENWDPLIPEERNLNSHQEAVEQLKDWITRRGRWLDEHIDALRQYCHPSRNKKYNH